MCKLTNIEFYNTPDGEVMVKKIGEAAVTFKETDREFISEMLSIINDRYPKAYKKLMELHSVSSMNRTHYEYEVVHHFIRCNFGEYDQFNHDINAFGQFIFEEVKCPLRGHCKYEGVICKPELDTQLTEREMEVFRLLATHMSIDDIAEELSISKFTIIRHKENIKSRLNCKKVSELIAYWHDNNLR